MTKRGDQIPQLADNLREFRKLRGMTLDELEERVGSRNVRMIELGRSVGSVQLLSAIAKVLNTTVDRLLAENGPSAADHDLPIPVELKRFLQTPLGRTVTAREKEELATLPARGREAPTEVTYQLYLTTLRSMPVKEDDKK